MANKGLAVEIAEVLDDYSKNFKGVVKESSKEAARQTARNLANTSPRKTEDYRKGWAIVQRGGAWIVHNRTEYRLTHLLEYGHATRNGTKRVFPDTPAHPHIKSAADEGAALYVELIERKAEQI